VRPTPTPPPREHIDEGQGHGHSHGLVDRSILRSRARVRAVFWALLILGVMAHPDMAYTGTFESFTQSGGLEKYLTTLE
jgi:hypothetical protein